MNSSAAGWLDATGADEAADLGNEEPGDEQADVRLRVRPSAPTPGKDEVEKHMSTHQPYRSWCRYCVAAAARRRRHERHKGEPTHDYSTHPLVVVDYCFLGADDAGEDGLTILVTKDMGTGMLWADVVGRKGVAAYALQQLVGHIVQLGWPRVGIRHDGEKPIGALGAGCYC